MVRQVLFWSSKCQRLDGSPYSATPADTLLRSFLRCISQHSIPKHVRIDNAKNFKSVSKRLTHILHIPKVQHFLAYSFWILPRESSCVDPVVHEVKTDFPAVSNRLENSSFANTKAINSVAVKQLQHYDLDINK